MESGFPLLNSILLRPGLTLHSLDTHFLQAFAFSPSKMSSELSVWKRPAHPSNPIQITSLPNLPAWVSRYRFLLAHELCHLTNK